MAAPNAVRSEMRPPTHNIAWQSRPEPAVQAVHPPASGAAARAQVAQAMATQSSVESMGELLRQLQAHTDESLNRFERRMMQVMREEVSQQPSNQGNRDADANSQQSRTSTQPRRAAPANLPTPTVESSTDSDHRSDGRSDGNSSGGRPREPRRSQYAVRKPLTPNLWGFTFSGDPLSTDRKDVGAPAFIRGVEMYRRSEKYSPEDMLDSVITLLRGDAKSWWMSKATAIRTYPQFIEEFRDEWFEPDADTTTYLDLVAYKQKSEPVHRYLINFEAKASYCVPVPTDKQMVDILKRNLAEDYRKDVDLKDPRTVADVKNICKRIDRNIVRKPKTGTTDRSSDHRPSTDRPRNRHVFLVECLGAEYDSDAGEEDFSPLEICTVNVLTSDEDTLPQQKREFTCFNCHQLGHVWRNCKQELKKPFCMGCGKEGVKIPDCPRKACQDFYQRRLARRKEREANRS